MSFVAAGYVDSRLPQPLVRLLNYWENDRVLGSNDEAAAAL